MRAGFLCRLAPAAFALLFTIHANGCSSSDRGETRVAGTTEGRQQSAFDQFVTREPTFREHYQAHYAGSGYDYHQYRPAYQHGFELALDPRYSRADWKTAERQAQRTWNEATMGSWDRYKDAVRYGWEQGVLLARG